jgi:hypothetical protein
MAMAEVEVVEVECRSKGVKTLQLTLGCEGGLGQVVCAPPACICMRGRWWWWKWKWSMTVQLVFGHEGWSSTYREKQVSKEDEKLKKGAHLALPTILLSFSLLPPFAVSIQSSCPQRYMARAMLQCCCCCQCHCHSCSHHHCCNFHGHGCSCCQRGGGNGCVVVVRVM